MQFGTIQKIRDELWEIPRQGTMQVPARVYATEAMLAEIKRDRSLHQLMNVASIPGVYKYALAMPDIHEGYGFPVGGVAAMDAESGLISPGGIGYDINCGVRLLRSTVTHDEIKPHLEALGRAIYEGVPSGVGRAGALTLGAKELDAVLERGVSEMAARGFAEKHDAAFIESGGALAGADASAVSDAAKKRGRDQLGTMGAGNHFVEMDRVEEIFDEDAARAFGLSKDQIVVLIHTGSRGLGHQIATDYIRAMMKSASWRTKYGMSLSDRELAAAPFRSGEGERYFAAMQAGANFAWANRQLITHEVRAAWRGVLGDAGGALDVVYDVAHNIAKLEEYDGKPLVVHRKGATRAFPPGHVELPPAYGNVGQPVLIPGSMGTASYVLAGQEGAMEESFGSSCHGAGRRMSRTEARREVRGEALRRELADEGIAVNAGSAAGLAEEAPEAYKDVDAVVGIVHTAGIAKKVARLAPAAVIKG